MKKIATLEVFEVEPSDDAETREASSFYQQGVAPWRDKHRIVLNPIHTCAACGEYDKVHVLAHELGHFVSHLTESPSAVADSNRNMYELLLGIDTRIPEEEYAWSITEKMGLPLDPERKARALASYRGE